MNKSTAQDIIAWARQIHIEAQLEPTEYPRVYWVLLEQPDGKQKVITQKRDWDRYRADTLAG